MSQSNHLHNGEKGLFGGPNKAKMGPFPANAVEGAHVAFGQPSPPRYLKEQVHFAPQELAPAERSLEDLYRENPDLRLGDLETTSMGWAGEVVLLIRDEAVIAWLRKWCPDMNLSQVLNSMTASNNQEKSSTKNGVKTFVVPVEALNHAILAGSSLPEMYLKTLTIYDPRKDERSLPFSKLMSLMDHCISFHALLKDDVRMAQLEKTKNRFLWFPTALDAKKLKIMETANREFDEVKERFDKALKAAVTAPAPAPANPTIGHGNGNGKKKRGKRNKKIKQETTNKSAPAPRAPVTTKAQRRAHEKQRKVEERKVLQRAYDKFEAQREAFRVDMIQALRELMQSTKTHDHSDEALPNPTPALN